MSRREAKELIVAMRSVLEVLPDSECCQSWRAIYRGIERHHGRIAIDFELPGEDKTPIQRSHSLAGEILRSGLCEAFPQSIFVTDRRGWWETEQHKREADGAIQHGWGTGYHLCGFFPAVRLALAVSTSASEWSDTASMWMKDRTRSVLLTKELSRSGRSTAEKRQQLQDAICEMPQQESLHLALGNLLVRDGQFDSGFEALSSALSMPHADGDTRASALYDLACIHARRGDEIACRNALTESASLKKLDKQWLEKDPDFESVRITDWFAQFLV
ncbi:MAG: hypothetical protein IAG10_09770 [Planctomycetaceae bacterium]|nr:hypothetical protein [Planctomycetaceae bacterium]